MIQKLFLAVGASTAVAQTGVVKLTSETFAKTLEENKFVLVKFFAPWCGHCKAMAADYEQAASMLAKEKSEVVIGEVDATVETQVAAEYDVQGYPQLYWFVNQKKREYTGPRTADGIVEWVKNNQGSPLKKWTSAEHDEAIKSRSQADAIYVFQGDDKIEALANGIAEDGKAVAVIAFVPNASKNSLTVYKGADETASYSGDYTIEAVEPWMEKERAPLFGQINEDNFEIYTEFAKKGLFWVCLDPATREEDLKKYSPALVSAARSQSAETNYPFVWLDISEFEAHAKEELGCTSFPTIVLQKGDLLGDREDVKVEKFVRSFSEDKAAFTKEGIATFFADIESGKLEAVAEPDELSALDDEDDDEAGEDDDIGEDKEEL